MNLMEILAERARSHPEQAALIEGAGERRRVLDYGELERRVVAGAGGLTRLGIGPGDVVLFLHPVSIELYVALLAVFQAGAVALFLDPSAGRGTVRSVLGRMAPKGFFASPKAHLWRLLHPAVRRIPRAFTTVPWIPGVRWPTDGPGTDISGCGLESPALITFTSGSTGEPKAVVRTHGFLLAQYETLRNSILLEEGEVDLITLPVFALANLAAGVTTVIADTDLARPGQADGEAIGRQLTGERITRCAASPAFFASLLNQGAALDGLRKVFTGGAPVFPSLLERLARAAPRATVEAVYGSTEAEPIAHIEWRAITAEDKAAMRSGRGLLAGRPVAEIRLAIVANQWGTPMADGSGEAFEKARLPVGQPGEIVVSGDHVLTGYLDGRGDEETKFRVEGTVWHRTGDAGWLDEGGRLWLLGRAGAVIQRDGGDLYPFAVETALSFEPEVKRSALVELAGKAVLAVEFGEGGGPGVVREAVAWAGIDRIVTLRRIPVDRRHQAKVDYPALRKVLGMTGSGS